MAPTDSAPSRPADQDSTLQGGFRAEQLETLQLQISSSIRDAILSLPSSVPTSPEPTVSLGNSSSLPQHLPPKIIASIRYDAAFPSTSSSTYRTTNRNSRILIPRLTQRANSLLGEAIPCSTRTTYSSGVRQYLDFCLAHNLASKENLLPATTEENLVYFVTSLQGNVQYRTVKIYLTAIANFYVEQGMTLRTDNMFQLHRILKGIKRTSIPPKRTRRPITIQILSEISDLLRSAFSEELDNVMLWAVFTSACSSSKSFLAVKDVIFVPNIQNPDHMKVLIKQSNLKRTRFVRALH